VFDLVGKEVLDNAWQGYHCCLFAYGQTGAGKSYSMVGYGANRGIVPIACEEIFKRIQANDDPNLSFELTFSMQEIYNERIQDLLIPVKDRPKEGLKVREHQKYGVYVDGLSRHPVDSYEAIESKMDEGAKNRTIGSTLMNASSSRAHTIMTIEFKKIEMINGKKTEKFAVINLVDLAGSEKAGKTGASGDRLKEGKVSFLFYSRNSARPSFKGSFYVIEPPKGSLFFGILNFSFEKIPSLRPNLTPQ